MGNPAIHTPYLDTLAEEGVLFDQCISQSPVCAPSRASLITGRYPHTCGVIWNFAPLPDYELSLPELLRANGYQTAVVGKHHLRGATVEKSFEQVVRLPGKWGGAAGNGPYKQIVKERGYELPLFMDDPTFAENLGVYPCDLPEELYVDSMVGERAVQFLEERAESPFFLWVGFHCPHHPYDPPERFLRLYDSADVPLPHTHPEECQSKPPEVRAFREYGGHPFAGGKWGEQTEEKLRRMVAAYYGIVSLCDEQIGRIVESLAAQGELENTLIIFTSDHGDFLGDHGIIGKGPFLYDSLIHVPLILRGPGCGRPGKIISTPMELVDIFPTVMDATGIQTPAQVQGRSRWGQFQGGEDSGGGYTFSETPSQRALRSTEWKYIRYLDKPYRELYDLTSDPHELCNLAGEMPDKVDELDTALNEYVRFSERPYHPSFQRFEAPDPLTGEMVSEWYTL